MNIHTILRRSLICGGIVVATLFTGCATYVTPGAPADLETIVRADMREVVARRPTMRLPALISVARIQAPDYAPNSGATYGSGAYTVVMNRSLIRDEHVDQLAAWPQVRRLSPLSRLLTPKTLTSIDDLRIASANLHSDILLAFTVDTSFRVDGKSVGPLSVLSLGLLRDRETLITSTASAVLVDVRTGFVYGTAEATVDERHETNAWSSKKVVDQSRLRTERGAFESLIAELGRTWSGIVSEHAAVAQE